jgi:flagellar hook-length control protein FliK
LAKSTAAITAVGMLPPAAPTAQDTMRIRLVPAWANVTQKLTQMSGTALTAAWGALTAATLGGPIRSVALDLRNSEALEAEATTLSLDTPTPNSLTGAAPELNRNNTAGGQLPTPAQPLPGMNQMLRQEHYQQLADRLGQAMAERLQSQIARGEWKLQMRLNPASLGRIDIELDMHANGLDAMFRSDNALTRELMAQSMPKLKDTLTQSGMAVASVWVNSDAGRQSDGNPTPEKESTPPTDNVASAPADNAQKAVTKEKRTPDGFDVLA